MLRFFGIIISLTLLVILRSRVLSTNRSRVLFFLRDWAFTRFRGVVMGFLVIMVFIIMLPILSSIKLNTEDVIIFRSLFLRFKNRRIIFTFHSTSWALFRNWLSASIHLAFSLEHLLLLLFQNPIFTTGYYNLSPLRPSLLKHA